MECGRRMIYFSTYENGVKTRRSGYAGVFIRGNECEVQLFYQSKEEPAAYEICPVYMFRDGTVKQGAMVSVTEGIAATAVYTNQKNFMESGRCLEELEVIYLDGVPEGICGGRLDGQELTGEAAYTLTDWMDTVAEVIPICKGETEETEETKQLYREEKLSVKEKKAELWTLTECMERFPEMKLPYDGVRRRCFRMTMEDLEHLGDAWATLRENHFLLHGYYEYHHMLLVQLCCRQGEKFAIGVPGEFCYRNQYMAENFGFYDFAPLEPGKRRGGSFGYWYRYLSGNGK